MDRNIEALVRSCESCQSSKHTPPVAPLHPWIWLSRRWTRIHVDFTGPKLGQTFLVVLDAYSKWTEV